MFCRKWVHIALGLPSPAIIPKSMSRILNAVKPEFRIRDFGFKFVCQF